VIGVSALRGLALGSLLLLVHGCGLFARGSKESRQRERQCASAVQVVSRDELMARPHRTLRTVSVSCGSQRDCVKTLVARACELHASAVFVHNSRVLSALPQEPLPSAPAYMEDPKYVASSPRNRPAPGPPMRYAADGQIVDWLSK
jgi:hypothetical protein